MKEQEILDVVKSKFKIINKLLHPILKDFNVDDIHDFREEVKELRAFLKLMNTEKKFEGALIPKLLKTFYGYTGIIRNIQLHRHNVFKYVTDHNINEPFGYIKILDNEQLYWKNDATGLMADNNFEDNENEVLNQLPNEFEKSAIKKFSEDERKALREVLYDIKDDVAIYTVRKILKEILFTWNFIKDGAALPKSISKPEDLKLLTTELDNFRDKCSELELLQTEYLYKINDQEEKLMLTEMKEALEYQKELIKQKLYPSFITLQNQL